MIHDKTLVEFVQPLSDGGIEWENSNEKISVL